MLLLHALTGCDTVSAFCGRGKKTTWNTWKVFPEVTGAFKGSLLTQADISYSAMAVLERCVMLLYDRTSCIQNVSECRKHFFAQKNRNLEN